MNAQIENARAELVPITRDNFVSLLHIYRDGDINDSKYLASLFETFLVRVDLYDDHFLIWFNPLGQKPPADIPITSIENGDVDEFFDILHDEPLDKWYRMGNVIAIVDAKQEQQLSPQSAYLLASETANAGMVVLSRSQLATPAEMDSTVNYLNHALEQNGCARRFGADVLRKNWEDLTPQDLAAVAACGSKQASYEKMHFDQHDVFSSLYFIDRHLPLPRLKEVVNELFADASCGRIMRIKGFTSDGNGWLELNASRDAMTLKPIAKAQEVIIVIGEQLNRAAIEAHWKEV